jgi:hypothetical protein
MEMNHSLNVVTSLSSETHRRRRCLNFLLDAYALRRAVGAARGVDSAIIANAASRVTAE